MKRILSILLSVTLVCLLSACGAPAQQGGDAPQADAAPMRALRLGTGSVGGTDNVAMGRKLAELVDEAATPARSTLCRRCAARSPSRRRSPPARCSRRSGSSPGGCRC